MGNKISSVNAVKYNDNSQNLIDSALYVIKKRMKESGVFMENPAEVKAYLILKMAELEHEVFSVLFLDSQHKLICYEEMFRGTINGSSVYPREVAKLALQLNASAVIFSHNHPSGSVVPSGADRKITVELKKSLSLFDIRVLDHIIIGGVNTSSFAELGYL